MTTGMEDAMDTTSPAISLGPPEHPALVDLFGGAHQETTICVRDVMSTSPLGSSGIRSCREASPRRTEKLTVRVNQMR